MGQMRLFMPKEQIAGNPEKLVMRFLCFQGNSNGTQELEEGIRKKIKPVYYQFFIAPLQVVTPLGSCQEVLSGRSCPLLFLVNAPLGTCQGLGRKFSGAASDPSF